MILWEVVDIILWSHSSSEFALTFSKFSSPVYFFPTIFYLNFVYEVISPRKKNIFYIFSLFASIINQIGQTFIIRKITNFRFKHFFFMTIISN